MCKKCEHKVDGLWHSPSAKDEESPSAQHLLMPRKHFERESFGKDVSGIVVSEGALDQNHRWRQLGAEPVMFNGQQLRTWCHSWWASAHKCHLRARCLQTLAEMVEVLSPRPSPQIPSVLSRRPWRQMRECAAMLRLMHLLSIAERQIS